MDMHKYTFSSLNMMHPITKDNVYTPGSLNMSHSIMKDALNLQEQERRRSVINTVNTKLVSRTKEWKRQLKIPKVVEDLCTSFGTESTRSVSVPECNEHKRERAKDFSPFKSESLKVMIEKDELKEKQHFNREAIVSSLCMSSSKYNNSRDFQDEEEDKDLDKFQSDQTDIYINRTSLLERGCPVEK